MRKKKLDSIYCQMGQQADKIEPDGRAELFGMT
jgi:hypothetical protein